MAGSPVVGSSRTWVGIRESKSRGLEVAGRSWKDNLPNLQDQSFQRVGRKSLSRSREKQSPGKSAGFPSGQEREMNAWSRYQVRMDPGLQRAHWKGVEVGGAVARASSRLGHEQSRWECRSMRV